MHVPAETFNLMKLLFYCLQFRKLPRHHHGTRGPVIWEFLMHLLKHPETNPTLVVWQNKSLYKFKLLRPRFITKLWNSRPTTRAKKNKNNFARSIRYHYSSGTLRSCYAKHAYQCGTQAIEYFNQLGN